MSDLSISTSVDRFEIDLDIYERQIFSKLYFVALRNWVELVIFY